MFKFLRTVAEKLNIIKPKTKRRQSARRQYIEPIRRPTVIPTQGEAKVTRYILSRFGHGNENNIRYRVKFMTPEEIAWTLRASRRQIQDKAAMPADRWDDNDLPLNPWWYK